MPKLDRPLQLKVAGDLCCVGASLDLDIRRANDAAILLSRLLANERSEIRAATSYGIEALLLQLRLRFG